MGLAERKDLGVRIGIEKAQKADEAIARSQVIAGRNIYFDYLPNWDIRINALTGGGGAGTGEVRNLIAYVKITLRPQDNRTRGHLDIQDETTGDGIETYFPQFYGTALFQDVYHNWNLPSKDHFEFSVEDLRSQNSPTKEDFSAIKSIPHVVGINANCIRIWATDAMNLTKTDPRLWVDTDGSNNMTNTRLVDRSDNGPKADNPFRSIDEDTYEMAPFYAIKITEITDLVATVNQLKTTDRVQ